MKKIFKFAAMAFAAVALFASCDLLNNNENDEQNAAASLDGKQWIAPWAAMGVDCVMDFGATTPGTFYLAYDANEMGLPGFATYIVGEYSIVPTDNTSGVVNITVEGMPAQIQYSNLDEDSVSITFDPMALVNVEYTLVTDNKPLFDGMTGEPLQ